MAADDDARGARPQHQHQHQAPFLPTPLSSRDLLFALFARLDAASLGRATCVSAQWRDASRADSHRLWRRHLGAQFGAAIDGCVVAAAAAAASTARSSSSGAAAAYRAFSFLASRARHVDAGDGADDECPMATHVMYLAQFQAAKRRVLGWRIRLERASLDGGGGDGASGSSSSGGSSDPRPPPKFCRYGEPWTPLRDEYAERALREIDEAAKAERQGGGAPPGAAGAPAASSPPAPAGGVAFRALGPALETPQALWVRFKLPRALVQLGGRPHDALDGGRLYLEDGILDAVIEARVAPEEEEEEEEGWREDEEGPAAAALSSSPSSSSWVAVARCPRFFVPMDDQMLHDMSHLYGFYAYEPSEDGGDDDDGGGDEEGEGGGGGGGGGGGSGGGGNAGSDGSSDAAEPREETVDELADGAWWRDLSPRQWECWRRLVPPRDEEGVDDDDGDGRDNEDDDDGGDDKNDGGGLRCCCHPPSRTRRAVRVVGYVHFQQLLTALERSSVGVAGARPSASALRPPERWPAVSAEGGGCVGRAAEALREALVHAWPQPSPAARSPSSSASSSPAASALLSLSRGGYLLVASCFRLDHPAKQQLREAQGEPGPGAAGGAEDAGAHLGTAALRLFLSAPIRERALHDTEGGSDPYFDKDADAVLRRFGPGTPGHGLALWSLQQQQEQQEQQQPSWRAARERALDAYLGVPARVVLSLGRGALDVVVALPPPPAASSPSPLEAYLAAEATKAADAEASGQGTGGEGPDAAAASRRRRTWVRRVDPGCSFSSSSQPACSPAGAAYAALVAQQAAATTTPRSAPSVWAGGAAFAALIGAGAADGCMLDLALYDPRGRLLMGRAGCEMWVCSYHSDERNEPATKDAALALFAQAWQLATARARAVVCDAGEDDAARCAFAEDAAEVAVRVACDHADEALVPTGEMQQHLSRLMCGRKGDGAPTTADVEALLPAALEYHRAWVSEDASDGLDTLVRVSLLPDGGWYAPDRLVTGGDDRRPNPIGGASPLDLQVRGRSFRAGHDDAERLAPPWHRERWPQASLTVAAAAWGALHGAIAPPPGDAAWRPFSQAREGVMCEEEGTCVPAPSGGDDDEEEEEGRGRERRGCWWRRVHGQPLRSWWW